MTPSCSKHYQSTQQGRNRHGWAGFGAEEPERLWATPSCPASQPDLTHVLLEEWSKHSHAHTTWSLEESKLGGPNPLWNPTDQEWDGIEVQVRVQKEKRQMPHYFWQCSVVSPPVTFHQFSNSIQRAAPHHEYMHTCSGSQQWRGCSGRSVLILTCRRDNDSHTTSTSQHIWRRKECFRCGLRRGSHF